MNRFNLFHFLNTALIAALLITGLNIKNVTSAEEDTWQDKIFQKPKNWIVRANLPSMGEIKEVEAEITLFKVDRVSIPQNLTFSKSGKDKIDSHSISFRKIQYVGKMLLSVEIKKVDVLQRNKNVSFILLKKNKKTGGYDEIPGAKVSFHDPKEGDVGETVFQHKNQ